MRNGIGAVVAMSAGLCVWPAQASDYGCKVLLCLANPDGPTALLECRPPIERLKRDLARGRGFPDCDEAKPALAQMGSSLYDPCPDGTTALPEGRLATMTAPSLPPPAAKATATSPTDAIPPWTPASIDAVVGTVYTGQGDLSETDVGLRTDGPPAPGTQQVCVGRLTGVRHVWAQNEFNGAMEQRAIPVYDRIVLMDAVTTPRYFDVTIEGELYRRVRW